MKSILHLNLHREFFAQIAARMKRTGYRDLSPCWRKHTSRPTISLSNSPADMSGVLKMLETLGRARKAGEGKI